MDTKKIILGVAIILAAIAGAIVAYLDDDPETVVDIPGVYHEVQDGVGTIKAGAVQEDVADKPGASLPRVVTLAMVSAEPTDDGTSDSGGKA